MKLDLTDKKILHELELNSRQSNSSIAKKIKVSKDTVGYRIKQLENKKIIRGFRTKPNLQKLGFTLYRTYFNFIDTSQKELDEIIKFLKNEKNTWWIAKQDGSWEFTFAFWTKTNEEFYEFCHKFMKLFRKHIKEKLTCPLIKYHEFPRGYLINYKNKELKKNNKETKIQIDNIDLEILKELSKNSRTLLIKISKKLKLDSMTIYHRIKKLEKQEIILGYTIDIDDSILERDFYTVEINLSNFDNLLKIQNTILSIKETTGFTESIGGYDIEFDLKLKNSKQYYEIIEKLKNKFPEIREIKYFRVIKNYKIIYMPEDLKIK